MVKNTNRKGVGLKKTLVGAALAASLFFLQAVPLYGSPKNPNKKTPISIILGAGKGLGSNESYSAELGMRIGRFAFVGEFGSRPDMNLQKIEENVFGDVYFQGREDLKDFSYLGGSLGYYHPISKRVSLAIGAGIGLESRIRDINENLLRIVGDEETLLASKKTSTPEKDIVGKISIGPSFKIKKLEINPNIGYKTGREKGVFANLRIILPISKEGEQIK